METLWRTLLREETIGGVRLTVDELSIKLYRWGKTEAEWRQSGMRTTFKIELKMDMPTGDEVTKEIMRKAMRDAAQILLAQAIMINERQPQIAVMSENSFDGPETIALNAAE